MQRLLAEYLNSLSLFGIDNELVGFFPHCLHLYLPFKSPSLAAIYFTKGDHCFINHCLINHSGIRNERIWTVKTNAGSDPSLDLLSFSFSPWLPQERPCALDTFHVPLKTMCVLVLGGVSIMSMRASWLMINSSHVYPYWSSVYLFYQCLGEGILKSLPAITGLSISPVSCISLGAMYLEALLLDA